jgi:hypothetical protein
MRALVGCLLGALATHAAAADADFVGEWDMSVQQGRMNIEALLSIRPSDDGLVAYVEGGPVPLVIDGNRIEFGVDDRKTRGGSMVRYFRGTLEDGRLAGEFGPDHEPTPEELSICERMPLACTVPTGTWSAVPDVPPDTSGPPTPFDLSGAWVLMYRPLYRYTADLTDSAVAWKADFDVTMDLPGLRCQSWGLVNSWAFRGYDPEIFQSDHQITIATGNEIRRIYLDGRRPPEYTDWYPMGFSSGRWEGSTLVVETTHLQPSIREWMGDPISGDARVTERYWMEDGTLVGIMTLHDPEYYNEPPIKHGRWRRADPDAVRFPTLCDADSFYRELYDEGRFDDYIERAHRRY